MKGDMKDLTPQQVVLLCILVAFVASIATGITVVSLMTQSTEPITQTINQVVEKTVERIVPVEKIISIPSNTQKSTPTESEKAKISAQDAALSLLEIKNEKGENYGLALIVADKEAKVFRAISSQKINILASNNSATTTGVLENEKVSLDNSVGKIVAQRIEKVELGETIIAVWGTNLQDLITVRGYVVKEADGVLNVFLDVAPPTGAFIFDLNGMFLGSNMGADAGLYKVAR